MQMQRAARLKREERSQEQRIEEGSKRQLRSESVEKYVARVCVGPNHVRPTWSNAILTSVDFTVVAGNVRNKNPNQLCNTGLRPARPPRTPSLAHARAGRQSRESNHITSNHIRSKQAMARDAPHDDETDGRHAPRARPVDDLRLFDAQLADEITRCNDARGRERLRQVRVRLQRGLVPISPTIAASASARARLPACTTGARSAR